MSGSSETPSRPLSPHLQVYKLPLPALMSITHRVTGSALVVGTLLLTWWLLAAAAGPEPFAVAQGFVQSWLGQLMLFGWTVALFYHLCNGVRHLWWDIGNGLEMEQLYLSGFLTIAASLVLSVIVWAIALFF